MSEGTIEQVLAAEATWCVLHGDSFFRLLELPPNSCDAAVCDPPSGISFMGADWDSDKGGIWEWIRWLSCIMERTMRALKPGAHALVWALPRTSHWTGMALELAGFEIRDRIEHLFGSGFPKSLNVAKAIDAHMGAEPTVIGKRTFTGSAALSTAEKGGTFASGTSSHGRKKEVDVTAATSEAAKEWSGWGTALKPSHEVWWLVRKPLEKGLTVAENVLKWGTGALNIDAGRVRASSADREESERKNQHQKFESGPRTNAVLGKDERARPDYQMPDGRFPPNLLLSHSLGCARIGTTEVAANPTWDTPNRKPPTIFGSEVSKVSGTRHANGRDGEASADKRYAGQGSTSFAPLPGARRDDTETVEQWECVDGCPVRELSLQSGESSTVTSMRGERFGVSTIDRASGPNSLRGHTDSGSAARYFPQFQDDPELDDLTRFVYAAKPSRAERDAGLQQFAPRKRKAKGDEAEADTETERGALNCHSTVKGQALLRYLVKLVTPPRGVVLTGFAGSGSEGMAAVAEGFRYIGIELLDTDDEPHASIARARIHHVEGREFVPRESLRAKQGPTQRSLFDVR